MGSDVRLHRFLKSTTDAGDGASPYSPVILTTLFDTLKCNNDARFSSCSWQLRSSEIRQIAPKMVAARHSETLLAVHHRTGPDQEGGQHWTPACKGRWDFTGIMGNTALVNSRYHVRIEFSKKSPSMWTRALNKFRQPCPWLEKSFKNTGFKWGQAASVV
jgi:hypothetical protein